MNSQEIATTTYDSGKVVVTDQIDDGVVEVYDIGESDSPIAVYDYSCGEFNRDTARGLAREYANGYINGVR